MMLKYNKSLLINVTLSLSKGLKYNKSSDYHPELALSNTGNGLVSKLIPPWKKVINSIYSELGSDGMKMIESIELKLL